MRFLAMPLASQTPSLCLPVGIVGSKSVPYVRHTLSSCEDISRVLFRGYVAVRTNGGSVSAQGLLARCYPHNYAEPLSGSMLDEGKNSYLCVLFVMTVQPKPCMFTDCSTVISILLK